MSADHGAALFKCETNDGKFQLQLSSKELKLIKMDDDGHDAEIAKALPLAELSPQLLEKKISLFDVTRPIGIILSMLFTGLFLGASLKIHSKEMKIFAHFFLLSAVVFIYTKLKPD